MDEDDVPPVLDGELLEAGLEQRKLRLHVLQFDRLHMLAQTLVLVLYANAVVCKSCKQPNTVYDLSTASSRPHPHPRLCTTLQTLDADSAPHGSWRMCYLIFVLISARPQTHANPVYIGLPTGLHSTCPLLHVPAGGYAHLDAEHTEGLHLKCHVVRR